MAFILEGETADGRYFVVDDIQDWDTLQDWIEYMESEYDVIDSEWEYLET